MENITATPPPQFLLPPNAVMLPLGELLAMDRERTSQRMERDYLTKQSSHLRDAQIESEIAASEKAAHIDELEKQLSNRDAGLAALEQENQQQKKQIQALGALCERHLESYRNMARRVGELNSELYAERAKNKKLTRSLPKEKKTLAFGSQSK